MPTTESEFSKITVGVSLAEGLDIAKANSYLASMNNVIKTLTEEGKAFSAAMKKSADSITQDMYVRKDMADATKRAFEAVRKKAVHAKDLTDIDIDPISYSEAEDVKMRTFTRQIKDKRKRADIAAQVKRQGGIMAESGKEGFFNITVPDVQDYRTRAKGSNAGAFISLEKHLQDEIRNSNKLINARARLAAPQLEYEPVAYFKSKGDRGSAYWAAQGEAEYKRRQKEEEGGKGSSGLGPLKTFGVVFGIYKAIEKLLSLVGKIYTAILSGATKAFQDTLKGQSLGLSGTTVMNLRSFASSKGMKESVFTDAQTSVQQKFGNITSLDQTALKSLALIIGPQLGRLVNLGVGQSNPQQILDLILNGFQDKARRGINSLGQQVGVEDAMRELTSYLQKIDPNWAEIYQRKMFDELSPTNTAKQRDLARGDINVWGSETITNPAGVTKNDYELASAMKILTDEMNALRKSLVDGLMVKLSASIVGFTASLEDLVMTMPGVSPEAKRKYYDVNREENNASIKEFGTAIGASKKQREKLKSDLIDKNPAYAKNPKLLDYDILEVEEGRTPKHATSVSTGTDATFAAIIGINASIANLEQGIKEMNATNATSSPEAKYKGFSLPGARAASDFAANTAIQAFLKNGWAFPGSYTDVNNQMVKDLNNGNGANAEAKIGEQARSMLDLNYVSQLASDLVRKQASIPSGATVAFEATDSEITIKLVDSKGNDIKTDGASITMRSTLQNKGSFNMGSASFFADTEPVKGK